MRGLDKIELLETNRSTTGWAMKVGPGVTWDKVMNIKHPSKFNGIQIILTLGIRS